MRLPCCLKLRLLLRLLRFAQIEQEALLFLAHALRKLAKSGLPKTKRAKRFALLYSKLTVLRAKRANALAHATHEFLTLQPQSTGLLCALNTHRGLGLTELSRLPSKLTRKLLAREARLTRRLRNSCLCLSALKPKLAGLPRKLSCKLSRRHARLRRQRLKINAILRQRLCICRGHLLAR